MSGKQVARDYPRNIRCDGAAVQIRLIADGDEAAILAFARELSPHDLLFLPRDISQPKVVAAWVAVSRDGLMRTVLAVHDAKVIGCVTLVSDPLSWSRHVGEMRVIVADAWRGKGLGQKLAQECFALALEQGIDKLSASMTVDQTGAIAVFEGLGFQAEALLRNQVKDREGVAHDLVILSRDMTRLQSQMEAYGLPDAV